MAHVKLILMEDVENLGLAGEEVNVAPGYARNFLLPRGLAAKATPAALRLLAARKDQIEARRRDEKSGAEALAAKLAEATVVLPMNASEEDQLFGSVSPRAIAEKLQEMGFDVPHQNIRIEEPIKSLGEFEVEAKLYQDIVGKIKVHVVRA